MARQTFGGALAHRNAASEGAALVATVGRYADIYDAPTGGALADIVDMAGAAISGSRVTVDAFSHIPLFQGPDGVDILYALLQGESTRWPLLAAYPAGRELGYDEHVGQTFAVTSTSAAAIPNAGDGTPFPLGGTFAPGERPVYLELIVPAVTIATAGGFLALYVYRDSTLLDGIASAQAFADGAQVGSQRILTRIPAGTASGAYTARAAVSGGGGTATLVSNVVNARRIKWRRWRG